MRAHPVTLLALIALTSQGVAQIRSQAVQKGDVVVGESRPASPAVPGPLRPSCSGAWIDGCLEAGTQRALIFLGFMGGAGRPVGMR